MSNENVKCQFTGAEIVSINDALGRVSTAIKVYEKIMFLGGPLPSSTLDEVTKFLQDKLKDAPVIGAPMPKPENQR